MSYQDGWIVFDSDLNKLLQTAKATCVLSGLSVSAKSGMTVTVASGLALIDGAAVYLEADTDVTLSAADATYPRKDIIVIDNEGTVSAITGTAESASPSGETGPRTSRPKPPDIPDGSILLAEIWVAAGVTSITSADITDRRVVALPSPLAAGDFVIQYSMPWNTETATTTSTTYVFAFGVNVDAGIVRLRRSKFKIMCIYNMRNTTAGETIYARLYDEWSSQEIPDSEVAVTNTSWVVRSTPWIEYELESYRKIYLQIRVTGGTGEIQSNSILLIAAEVI